MALQTRKRRSRGGIGGIIALLFCLYFASLTNSGLSQTTRPEATAKMVYEQVADLPKDNGYTRRDTGSIDPDNTLVSRLIRYHQDVKKRFTALRFDWQLTLGDYLGINEVIIEERYPGSNTLTVNPMNADIQAIQALNRRQRDNLVTILVSIYNPENILTPTVTPNPTPTVSPSPVPRTPALSKPGDADLLKVLSESRKKGVAD